MYIYANNISYVNCPTVVQYFTITIRSTVKFCSLHLTSAKRKPGGLLFYYNSIKQPAIFFNK